MMSVRGFGAFTMMAHLGVCIPQLSGRLGHPHLARAFLLF